MIEIVLFIIGLLISIFGLVTTIIAARFNPFSRTPFSQPTFSYLCYTFDEVCHILVVIGVFIMIISVF